MQTNNQQTEINRKDYAIIFGLFLISFLLRFYAFLNTPLINHDGVWYINQAKALALNNWELARDCGYDFISLYHLLIPVFYKITGDWIIAGMSISLIFGSLTVIPMYLMLRHFFDMKISFMAGLALSVNPFFVSYSVELIKDPLFWFFGLCGICLFITAIKNEKKSFLLIFSNISFLIAGFARFEIIIYMIGSIVYILFFENKKFKKIFFFIFPAIVLTILVNFLNTLLMKEALYLWNFYFVPRNQRFFEDLWTNVFTSGIFEKSIISLDLLQRKLVRVIYLPYVIFFITGIFNIYKEIKRDKDLIYLILLSLCSLFALYLFYLKINVLSPRYTVFFILPAFVFFCSGSTALINILKKIKIRDKIVISFLVLYIVITAFIYPSNFIPRTSDKIIYRTIGEFIAGTEKNQNTVVIASDSRVMFYANLKSQEILCGNKLIKYDHVTELNYNELVKALKNSGAKYFLWEAKFWKNNRYNFQDVMKNKDFVEVKKWDNNRAILYRIL